MSEKLSLSLHEPGQTEKALAYLSAKARQWVAAGVRLTAELGPEKQQPRHVRHYHSLIGQISDHVGGDLANRDDAKRILVSAFKIDTQSDPDLKQAWQDFDEMRMGRGLRGEVVILGNQTRNFKKKLATAFIEWLYAFGAEQGVVFKVWGEDEPIGVKR